MASGDDGSQDAAEGAPRGGDRRDQEDDPITQWLRSPSARAAAPIAGQRLDGVEYGRLEPRRSSGHSILVHALAGAAATLAVLCLGALGLLGYQHVRAGHDGAAAEAARESASPPVTPPGAGRTSLSARVARQGASSPDRGARISPLAPDPAARVKSHAESPVRSRAETMAAAIPEAARSAEPATPAPRAAPSAPRRHRAHRRHRPGHTVIRPAVASTPEPRQAAPTPAPEANGNAAQDDEEVALSGASSSNTREAPGEEPVSSDELEALLHPITPAAHAHPAEARQLTREDIKAAFQAIRARVLVCASRTGATGTALLRVIFEPSGQVSSGKVVGSLANHPFARCATPVLKRVHTSGFDGAPRSVTFPILLRR